MQLSPYSRALYNSAYILDRLNPIMDDNQIDIATVTQYA